MTTWGNDTCNILQTKDTIFLKYKELYKHMKMTSKPKGKWAEEMTCKHIEHRNICFAHQERNTNWFYTRYHFSLRLGKSKQLTTGCWREKVRQTASLPTWLSSHKTTQLDMNENWAASPRITCQFTCWLNHSTSEDIAQKQWQCSKRKMLARWAEEDLYVSACHSALQRNKTKGYMHETVISALCAALFIGNKKIASNQNIHQRTAEWAKVYHKAVRKR